MYALILTILYFGLITFVLALPFWIPYIVYLQKNFNRLKDKQRFNVVTGCFKFYFRLITMQRPFLP